MQRTGDAEAQSNEVISVVIFICDTTKKVLDDADPVPLRKNIEGREYRVRPALVNHQKRCYDALWRYESEPMFCHFYLRYQRHVEHDMNSPFFLNDWSSLHTHPLKNNEKFAQDGYGAQRLFEAQIKSARRVEKS